MINELYNNFEYCVVNACSYNIEELKNIFNIIKIKKPLEVAIYLNQNNKNFDTAELEALIYNNLSSHFFWSSHGYFTYYNTTNL